MTGLFLLVKQMLDLTPALSGDFSRAVEVLVEETLYVKKNNCQKKLKWCLFSDMTLPSGLMWDWLGVVPPVELGPGHSLG